MKDTLNLPSYTFYRLRCCGDLIPPADGDKRYALDVGCGHAHLFKILSHRGYFPINVDIDIGKLRMAKDNALAQDAQFLGIRKDTFDLVVALEVIEHLKSARSFLLELKRVLKPNGCLLISTPNTTSLEGIKGKVSPLLTGRRWNAWGGGAHKHVYSSQEYLKLLDECFEIIKVCGFYPLMDIPFLPNRIKYCSICSYPLNRFCFITIALCRRSIDK